MGSRGEDEGSRGINGRSRGEDEGSRGAGSGPVSGGARVGLSHYLPPVPRMALLYCPMNLPPMPRPMPRMALLYCPMNLPPMP
eukprot:2538158-Rhodomonas_salina.1